MGIWLNLVVFVLSCRGFGGCGGGCWFLVGGHCHWVMFCILDEFCVNILLMYYIYIYIYIILIYRIEE